VSVPKKWWDLRDRRGPGRENFLRWVAGRSAVFENHLPWDKPTAKAALFLALYDTRPQWRTYDDLIDTMVEKGVILLPGSDEDQDATEQKREAVKESLRVAMRDLKKALDGTDQLQPHSLVIEETSRGRESQFRLIRRAPRPRFLLIPDPPADHAYTSDRLAQRLVEDRTLDFASLYVLPRPACFWVAYSTEQEIEKRAVQIEAAAWEDLQVRDYVLARPSPAINLVGLGCGEGLGEFNLLEKLFADPSIKGRVRVHYLAVELSPILLVLHAEKIRDRFKDELENGTLVFVGVLGDVFHLKNVLARVRDKVKEGGLLDQDEEFLPGDAPSVLCYFGNTIGNEKDGELKILHSIEEAFPKDASVEPCLAVLLGVSVVQSHVETYGKEAFRFLLQTPHELLHNLKRLESDNPTGGEFDFPKDDKEIKADALGGARYICTRPGDAKVRNYEHSVPAQIRGQIYSMAYRLRTNLKHRSSGATAKKGQLINLYVVIKYELETLRAALEDLGWRVKGTPDDKQWVETQEGKRKYAVLALFAS
jgi:hypothetical protein